MNRYLLLLILLGGALDCRVASAADPLTCSAFVPFPPKVRAEGLAEMVSDVLIFCNGGTPALLGATLPSYDIKLTFNANVTSRMLGSDGKSSEALLLLDEPDPTAQFPCEQVNGFPAAGQPDGVCHGEGNGNGFGNVNDYYGPGTLGLGGNRNVFQGVMDPATRKTLLWKAIPFDPPGNTGTTGFSRILRFANLRLDPTSLPAGGDLKLIGISMTGTNGTIQVPMVTSNSATTDTLVVATAQASLLATVRDAANAALPTVGVTVPVSAAATVPVRAATLRFESAFFRADRTRTNAPYANSDTASPPINQNVPGGLLGTETGFYNASFGSYGVRGNLGTAGLADSGTRYMAVFNNIPTGYNVYVDLYNSTDNTNAVARLINVGPTGSGAFVAATGSGNMAQLTVTGGQAIAVWEVLRTDVGTSQYDFGVYLSYPGSTATAPATTNIQMMYAPTGGKATPPTNAIPVFDGTVTAQTLFTYTLSSAPLPTPAPTPTPTPGTGSTPTPKPGGNPLTPTLMVSPLTMSFSGAVGGQNPPAQFLQLSSTTQQTSFNISSGGTIPFQPFTTDGVTYRLVPISVDLKGLAAGTLTDTLTVTNTIDGTTTAVAVTLTLTGTPQILSLSAVAVQAGGPGFSLAVNGSNFTSVNAVRWNGKVLTTSYVSAGQLTALIPASLLKATGAAAITVTTPDGAASNSVSLSIEKYTIASLSPDRAVAGDAGFTLTITGSGLVQGSTLNFGGAALPAISVTDTQIVAAVPANLIANAGPIPVSVGSPAGTVSNSLAFTVGSVFGIDTISPTAVTVGGPSFTLEISGAGFAGGTTVQVGMAEFHPDSLAAGKIVVTVPAAMIARVGSLSVSLLRPGLLPSNGLTLTVSALPAITALDPPSVVVKGAPFTLNVWGTGFLTGATVRWNAQFMTTTLVSSTQLTALVPAAWIASVGTAIIDVSAGGDAFSSATMIRITPPGPPTLTSISPETIPVGTAVSITLSGTGFTPGCAVVFTPPSGAAVRIVTDSCAPTQVVVRLPASVVGAPGSAGVQVTNPDGLSSPSMQVALALPPFPGLSFAAPLFVPSGQDQPLTLMLNGPYPVAIQGTLTITFAPDGDLPDDPAIQFQNGSRIFAFTIPAGTQPQIQATMKSGTVAGLVTITPTFAVNGADLTPPGGVAQRIRIAPAAPVISLLTCTRTPSGFVAVADGFTNTRAAALASFDLQSASGDSLGTIEIGADGQLPFTGWFGSEGAAAAGGVFRYTQTITSQVDASKIVSATVTLSNTVGTSTAASCQLQ